MIEVLKRYAKGKGYKFYEAGDKVYCKLDNRSVFKSGKKYKIHQIQLINGNEKLFIMAGDDGFPYQFYTLEGSSLLFLNHFTADIKEIRKMKLDNINDNKN